MGQPLVSVCLPNLNTRPFLQERVDTIFAQTYRNWELVVSDNFSEDGAWEFFTDLASRDRRVRVEQAPRAGLYPNWNNCVRRARGQYVYIATSDDTMAADCLAKMVAALERRPDCDLAHCNLRLIDENGAPTDDPYWRWPECTSFAHGPAGLEHKLHVRFAPYDGLLHLARRMVYHSITELLIRRSLFAKIGEFEARWGSSGDFNWEMRAGLVANTVHVPDTWASFRYHSSQATAAVATLGEEHERRLDDMVLHAVDSCEPFLAPSVVRGLREHWLEWSRDLQTYYRQLRDRPDAGARRMFQLKKLLTGPPAARWEVIGRMHGKPKWHDRAPHEIGRWLQSLGMTPFTILASEVATPRPLRTASQGATTVGPAAILETSQSRSRPGETSRTSG